MKSFIIEIHCKPSDKSSSVSFASASICAISETEESAISMAKNLVIDHGYIVESVEFVSDKSSIIPDKNSQLDELLYQKALQREPRCAVQFFLEDLKAVHSSVSSLNIPDVSKVIN